MGEGKYSENFYAGADYGISPSYAGEFSTGLFPKNRYSAGSFGLPTDPRTANQIKAISDKLNTGAKTIEVSGVVAGTWETVPEPHLVEINRLKKLSGVDLTFHGPLIEPTGFSQQEGGWDEARRKQAERQMWQAMERAHKMDPNGNLVVTFHSSNGIPDPVSKGMQEVYNPVTGKKEAKEVITQFAVITSEGQVRAVKPTPNYLLGEGGQIGTVEEQQNTVEAAIDKQNKDTWFQQLQNLSYHAYAGKHTVDGLLKGDSLSPELKIKTDEKQWLKLYKHYLHDRDTTKVLDTVGESVRGVVEKQLQELAHGDIYLRDAYQAFQRLYNEAYQNSSGEDLKKLEQFRREFKGVQDLEDPQNLQEFGKFLIQGVNVLRSIEPPSTVKPLREFALDKSSDTFSNIAFNSYKKFGDTAPIVSIENPPAGSGLARGSDLRDLVDQTRKKLAYKLVNEMHLAKGDAEKEAEKLVGVTWDVGHINMLKKFGYKEKDIKKEAEAISPYLNKIHLSDNFGMEHTELPMGMGNVDLKVQYEALRAHNKQMEKIKQIVETGNWFGPQAFGNQTPFLQTLKSFGSPIYSMKMGPYWNQSYGSSGGYFSGYGQVLPEQHFSLYGAGFSNMPKELGGQMSGRSRVGGTPME